MVLERIQSEDLCKIRSGSGDKKTSSVDAKNKLTEVYGTKYRINLDHQILTDHGVFYPQGLYNDLMFELTLAPANQVVKGVDATKLKYKLNNIQLEYEMLRDSPPKDADRESLGDQATFLYTKGKEFLYDHVTHDKVIPFKKGTDTRINVKVNAQRSSMKGLLLLFVEPYTGGARFRKIHLPRHKENQRHDKRLAQHAVQQRHRSSGHLERGQPLFHERKTQAPAHEYAEVLHQK